MRQFSLKRLFVGITMGCLYLAIVRVVTGISINPNLDWFTIAAVLIATVFVGWHTSTAVK